MKLHCDICGRYLGDYLYGEGGVEEKAIIKERLIDIPTWEGSRIVGIRTIPDGRIPDIICFECVEEKE